MLNKEKYQNAAVVNYPNNYNFIRITEFKHLTGQIHPNTSILREYPCQYKKNDPEKNVPCYPIFTSENQKLFEKYNQLIKQYENIISIGRLAEYQYYDMDDIVERALKVFERAFETL
jgi:UDP-galactopyranose mutase